MKLPQVIKTERLHLRPVEMRDLDGYMTYYTSPRTANPSGPPPPYAVVERFMAMAGQWVLRGYGRYAITDGAEAFGHVGVLHRDAAPEMTWSLWDHSREGKGLAFDAARVTLDAWFNAGGEAIIAMIDKANLRSQALARRLGMVHAPDQPAPDHFPNAQIYLAEGAA